MEIIKLKTKYCLNEFTSRPRDVDSFKNARFKSIIWLKSIFNFIIIMMKVLL